MHRPIRRLTTRELRARRRPATAKTAAACRLSFREPTLSGQWAAPCPRCGLEHESEATWQDVEWQ